MDAKRIISGGKYHPAQHPGRPVQWHSRPGGVNAGRLQRLHVCLWPDRFRKDLFDARLTVRSSEKATFLGHLGASWGYWLRDNPGVYTRTFSELFKVQIVDVCCHDTSNLAQVVKERSAWKIELKGVQHSVERCLRKGLLVAMVFLLGMRGDLQ